VPSRLAFRRVQRVVLGLILVAGFALRVWHNDYGLPFVYSIDEASHFTSRAVEMFWQDLDPGYYQNPAAYTYLIYGTLRVLYGPLGFLFGLPYGNVTTQFDKDPNQIWIVARTLAAVLSTAGVAATYWAARRLWGVREGLVAAALMAFAFLPVAYSRVAVTDVGSLVGVALALMWSARAADEGRTRDFVLAGAAAGLAIAFKYTAGLVLLPLAIAAVARLRVDGARPLAGLAAGGLAAAVVFALLNPYLFGSLGSWWSDLRDQADVAAQDPKPGQESGGFSYYLDSLTWGLGWAGMAAALAGAVLVLRRDVVRGLVLVAMPLALFFYLALQARYFGRWLLPAYPALALLGAVGVVALADLVTRVLGDARRAALRPVAAGAVLAAITAVVLVQPLAADVRSAQVLGRDDTLSEARAWLDERYQPELRVAVEPAVPGRWFRSTPVGTNPPWLTRCPRRDDWTEAGWSYAGEGGRQICAQYKPGLFARPDGGVRASSFHSVLGTDVIDDYRLYGYCLVMTVNTVQERALETGDPDARAYYERLGRESRVVAEFSPYDEGADSVPFSFDLSYNSYPPEYERPGPTVRIHRLDRCRQAYGPPVIRIPKATEPPPFS
jgi:4-amino-4-deoxy-L-arabinose transferase-like glycosyltransferase